ncbi:hypothetical protein Clacol_007662 [Clathrus columnatus]|uniref:NADP-dependent oxidoreductase domain-containing protein n=1 Tax=Clathrus columnatus TaxID=1419009 RepID=A0AAV5AL38_9AGAM|nr:hypothetical protein Clacol_007662 [Clathrus columnatus]
MSSEYYISPPPPPTKLGRYRVLSPNASVYVSPLQLGGASIGDKWSNIGMGKMDKDASIKLLDAYYDAGGNFIDTSCNYQDGTSEEFIGEWMEKRGIRDEMVIATKYSSFFKRGDPSVSIKVNYVGNGHKSLHLSVEGSLKRLRTTYIDILYVHWWTWDSSIEEVMSSLHNLVVARKGISDTPAWIVVKANQWAKFHGKTPFCVYQGRWNILDRSFERDIIPMAKAEGLALAPFGVLAEGRIRTDEEERRRKETGENGRSIAVSSNLVAWERNEDERKVCKKLEEIANELGAKNITSIAIAYVMHKAPYVFPIIGGRKVEHLQSNVEALDIKLTPEHIKSLESLFPFEPGFPHNVIIMQGDGSAVRKAFLNVATLDKWEGIPALPTPANNKVI